MTDEKFDLEKYLQMLAAADPSGIAHPSSAAAAARTGGAAAGEERTTPAPEQGETEKQGLLERLARWVRRRVSGYGTRSGGAASPLAPSAVAQADGSLHLPPAARTVGSARASAPAAFDASDVDDSSGTFDSPSEARRRTRAQAELPPAQPVNRVDASDGGNSAVSAARQPKRANAHLPAAVDAEAGRSVPPDASSGGDGFPTPDTSPASSVPRSRDVAETSSGRGTPYTEAVRSAAQADDAPAQIDTERSAGEVAPSERAHTPPDTSRVPNASDTEESFSVARQRTHAQPATSPQQQPTPTDTSYLGEVAGASSAAEWRRPKRATVGSPAPQPTLHSLARTLDRELRRYG